MSEDAEKGISQRDESPLVKNAIKEKSISYYKKLEFDKIFCSPLLRTKQTAEALFGDDFGIVDYIYEYKSFRVKQDKTFESDFDLKVNKYLKQKTKKKE